jgi:hypothetical protein
MDTQNCTAYCQPIAEPEPEPAPGPIPTIKLVAASGLNSDSDSQALYYSTMPIYGVVLLTIFCVLLAVALVVLGLFLFNKYRHRA